MLLFISETKCGWYSVHTMRFFSDLISSNNSSVFVASDGCECDFDSVFIHVNVSGIHCRGVYVCVAALISLFVCDA